MSIKFAVYFYWGVVYPQEIYFCLAIKNSDHNFINSIKKHLFCFLVHHLNLLLFKLTFSVHLKKMECSFQNHNSFKCYWSMICVLLGCSRRI